MTSIIIADSHHLFREALCAYLRHADTAFNIHGVDSMESLQSVFQDEGADIVLVDAALTGWNGKPTELDEDTKIGLLLPLLQGEVEHNPDISGIFPKSLSCKAFMGGIQTMLDGRKFFPSLNENANALGHDAAGRKHLQDFHLTGREKEVLGHLVKGESNKEIARALDLQVVTVKLHVRGICRKMKASNRTQAALLARENGWS